jgi:hypothetical protein
LDQANFPAPSDAIACDRLTTLRSRVVMKPLADYARKVEFVCSGCLASVQVAMMIRTRGVRGA